MILATLTRNRKMILASLFFFYLGCGLTVSFLRIECSENVHQTNMMSIKIPKVDVSMDGVEYVAIVLSSPNNEQQRDAIRMTWGNLDKNIITENGERFYKWNHTRSSQNARPNFIKTLFFVGTHKLDNVIMKRLEVESLRTGDIVLLKDFTESYDQLTHKLIAALRWLHHQAHELKYVIKCDDDSFVRLDLIVSELDANGNNVDVPQLRRQSEESYNSLYWGYFNGRAKVFTSGKWKEEEWFLCDHYMPYAIGGGYVISKSIVRYVATNSDMLHKYKSEDVTMGVWTAALTGINRVHDVRFDTEIRSRGCQHNTLVRHKQSTKEMFAMYDNLMQSNGKRLCKIESTNMKSYVYNWNVLPSHCCS